MKKRVTMFPPVSKYFISALLLMIGLSNTAVGQCAQSLRAARTAYDEGQLQKIASIIQGCMNAEGEDGFNDDDKTAAYRLLILTYLFTDEPEKADQAMLDLLSFNPQYQINEASDPAELINLYRSFRTWPIFHYGVKGGGNLTLVEVLNTFSVQNPVGMNGEYELNPGFQIGVTVEIPINERWIVNPEISISSHFTTYKNNFAQIDSINRFITQHDFQISQTNIMLPVTVQYKLPLKSKLNPYILAGGSASYALSANFNGQTDTSNESFEGATIDLIPQREPLNFGAIVGAGIKIKAGKNQFQAELRFNYGFRNQVDESERLGNQELIFDYGYVESDFRMHSLMLSVGYLLPKYNPKKLSR
ncbi:MAG: porin family protein [Bacteroidota bacterium]